MQIQQRRSGERQRRRVVAILSIALALAGSVTAQAQQSRVVPKQAAASKYGTQAAPSAQPTGLLYVWDADIPASGTETRKLLRYARLSGFNAIAIDAWPVGYAVPGAQDDFADFVDEAKRYGISVHALMGYGWFTVSPLAALPGQPTSHLEGFEMAANIAGSGLFAGLVEDSQPYAVTYVENGASMNWLWDQTAVAAQDYLDYLAGLRTALGGLPLIKAVPHWFDSHPLLGALWLDGEPEAHSLAWYAARRVDVLNVLAYRDQSQGPGGILEISADEFALGVPIWLAVETADLGPALDYVTFWEEGTLVLSKELSKTWQATKSLDAMAGLAVHHYDSLRLLGPSGPK